MASVLLKADGSVEVLVPATPEEVVEAQAAFLRVVEALARLAAKQDYEEAVARARGLAPPAEGVAAET